MHTIDDPYCHFVVLANGTTLISYSGSYGAWETEQMPCQGINLRVANILISIAALLMSSACLGVAYRNGKKRGWTIYNVVMTLGPMLFTIGNVMELYSTVDYFQWGGKADWSHLPKLFWYHGALAMAFVQGFRIEFILIALNKPRHWDRYLVGSLVSLGYFGFLVAVTLFFMGIKYGADTVPLNFATVYIGFYMIVGTLDVVLSVAILSICANNVALLKTFDTLSIASDSTEAANRFVRLNRIPAIAQLFGDAFCCICFIAGALFDGGYTTSVVSILALPSQNLFLLYSIECMRRAQQCTRPATATTSSEVGGEPTTFGKVVGAPATKRTGELARFIVHHLT